MTNFKKTVRVGTVKADWRETPMGLYVFIEYKDGKLSLYGVEGPKMNGDAVGGCGKIIMHEWDIVEYGEGFNAEAVAKLRDIWNEYHLNDMRPYSPEMKAAGWHKLAERKIDLHHFTQSAESLTHKNAAKGAALDALAKGETFTPTPEQVADYNAPYEVTLWTEHGAATPGAPKGYEPKKDITTRRVLSAETKTLGWLRPSEHPEGLLGRKLHPGDAHGYGCKGWKEDVPADVLEWLRGLPATTARLGQWARS